MESSRTESCEGHQEFEKEDQRMQAGIKASRKKGVLTRVSPEGAELGIQGQKEERERV